MQEKHEIDDEFIAQVDNFFEKELSLLDVTPIEQKDLSKFGVVATCVCVCVAFSFVLVNCQTALALLVVCVA